jgi:flavin reductase (DIM6/NTAB) family NADH-FMN oxidoreductase RutF
VSVCVKHGSWTWKRLRLRERIGMSFLGDTHAAAARQLAQKADDRFRGLGYEVATGGAVFMNGAAAWLDCAIEREIQAGDHDIVLFRLNRATVADEIMPLIYHASGFHALAPIRPSDHSPVADRSAAHDDQAEARSADAITDQQRVS